MEAARLMMVFEKIPEGLCKEVIRRRAEELRLSGQSMFNSLDQAMQENVESGGFPEVWVYIRTQTPIPFEENDTRLALQAVNKVEHLMVDLVELKKKYDALKEKYKATLESNRDMDNVERVVALALKMRELNAKMNLEELD